jgi:hypothetical protein
MAHSPDALPPHAQLLQIATAAWVSRIVYAAAELGLPDELAKEPRTAADIAAKLGLHADALHRLMRTLTGLGVLRHVGTDRFGLTPLGDALRTGAPGLARSTVVMAGRAPFQKSFDEILHAIRTGETGFSKAFGMAPFDYLARNPEEASLFSEMMVSFHGAEPPAVAEAYDFGRFGTVVDVGGATGNLLATVLAAHPGPRGILFDRPYVADDARAFLASKRMADRIAFQGGSFFESVPEGGDAYLLSHVIHDWSQEQCLTILGHVRRAMKPDGTLLLVEMVLPHDDAFHPGKVLDMVMLTIAGGRERTAEEYASLLAQAGFRQTRVVPTASPVSLVEAVSA